MADLTVGTQLDIPQGVRVLSLDVRWTTGTQTAFSERIGVAALPLVRDRVESRQHVVFSNQPSTPDETTRLGDSDGVVEIDLVAAPADVERVVLLVFVHPRANAPRRTLNEMASLDVTLRDDATGQELGRTSGLAGAFGPVPAATVGEMVRTPSGWRYDVTSQGFDAGLDGALQMAGARL